MKPPFKGLINFLALKSLIAKEKKDHDLFLAGKWYAPSSLRPVYIPKKTKD